MATKHRKPRRYIRTTIAEPFPVFYSHVTQKCRRANDPATEGPFYVAGSEWFEPYSERALAWKTSAAEGLRRDGYTVAVDVVEKI
jgi:hypothetical protein